MRPGTNRLLMLLIGAAISGCASQTDRSSSGGGAEPPAQVATPQPAPVPAYEPEKESVQFVDRPLQETPPPKPAVAAPEAEALPEFPITKYELPEEEAVEELGPQEDESVSGEQEALQEEESSVGETTEYPEDQQEEAAAESAEVEDLGPLPDESGSVTYPEDQRTAENTVGEPTVYPDEKPTPAPPPVPVAPKSVSVNFEAEPLFNFDKFAIRADQHEKLDEFIASLHGTQYDSISVVGHADRIGTQAYNQKLSERRAESVKAYLVSKGIEAQKIRAEGRGKSDPVTGDACSKVRGKKLISCLQPDRRVDVSVSAKKTSN